MIYIGENNYPIYLGEDEAVIYLGEEQLYPSSIEGLAVKPTSLAFENKFEGSKTFNVVSEYAWTASKDADWITISASAGESGRTKVTLSVSENDTDAERSGSVTVTDSNSNSVTLSVSQSNNGYVELDYVRSNNGYIDTGIYTDINTEVRLKFTPLQHSQANPYYGVYDEVGPYFARYWGGLQIIGATNVGTVLSDYADGTEYTAVHTKTGMTVNGTFYEPGWTAESGYQNTHTFLIGAASGYGYTGMNSKWYYMKIYQDGTLIRDFVPASFDGVYGMWDKVEMKFYAPASGTFLGPE